MGWILLAILAIIFAAIEELLPILGVLIVIVIGYFLLKWVGKGLIKAGRDTHDTAVLASSGLKKRKEIREKSAQLLKESTTIDSRIERLLILREQNVNHEETNRLYHFTSLLERCEGGDYARNCLAIINQKKDILAETASIEREVLELADKYKAVGNAEKCSYYLGFVKPNGSNYQLTRIEAECTKQAQERKKESEAMKRLLITIAAAIGVVFIIWAIFFAIDTPYREFKSDIQSKTLTKAMLEYSWRDEEKGKYYECFQEDRGQRIVNNALNGYMKDDDAESALWLLYTISYSGYSDEEISSLQINEWLVNYGLEHGVVTTGKEDRDDEYYPIYCQVHGYKIIVYEMYGTIKYKEMAIDLAE